MNRSALDESALHNVCSQNRGYPQSDQASFDSKSASWIDFEGSKREESDRFVHLCEYKVSGLC